MSSAATATPIAARAMGISAASSARVMSAIELCRTAALGGHVEACADCGLVRCAYNSCRNRHCPKCQGLARADGSPPGRPSCCRCPISMSCSRCRRRSPRSPSRTRRRSTPSCSRPRPRRCAPSRPIPSISAPRSGSSPCSTPGARTCTIIRTSIASCRVAGLRWTARAGSPAGPASSCRSACSRACSAGCSSIGCAAAFDAGALGFFGDLARLADPVAFAALLAPLRRFDWVVYAKPPFGGPEQVLAYLGRYTHRVAIANCRLVT